MYSICGACTILAIWNGIERMVPFVDHLHVAIHKAKMAYKVSCCHNKLFTSRSIPVTDYGNHLCGHHHINGSSMVGGWSESIDNW
jgi:hypothetical protein